MPQAAVSEVRVAKPLPFKLDPPDPERLQRLLVQVERPLIDAAVRARLVRLMQFYGEGHIVLLITTITESEGNADALIEPIVSAVSDIMKRRPEWPERGSQWLEAFDLIPLVGLLQVFRDLDAFTEREIADHYVIAVGRRLARRFAEIDGPPPPPPGYRISAAQRVIEQGLELLKHKGPHATSPICQLGRDRFGLDPNDCSKVMNVARLYGDRGWLVEKLSRDALFNLASPSLPAAARDAAERRLRTGERVTSKDIRRMKADQPQTS